MPLDDRRHKKPFSNKQKKEQLQAKRERKRNKSKRMFLVPKKLLQNIFKIER